MIKYQSYPKSRKIDAFGQEIFNYHSPTHVQLSRFRALGLQLGQANMVLPIPCDKHFALHPLMGTKHFEFITTDWQKWDLGGTACQTGSSVKHAHN